MHWRKGPWLKIDSFLLHPLFLAALLKTKYKWHGSFCDDIAEFSPWTADACELWQSRWNHSEQCLFLIIWGICFFFFLFFINHVFFKALCSGGTYISSWKWILYDSLSHVFNIKPYIVTYQYVLPKENKLEIKTNSYWNHC